MTNEEIEIIKTVFQSYLNIVRIFKKPSYISEEVVTEVRDKLIKALEQQPCEDCISRQALIEKATSWDKHFADSERYVSLTDIQGAPSVTPQPKRGKWKVIRKEYEFMGGVVNEARGCKCSNCNGIVKLKSDFCPSCGCYCGGDDNGDSECTM